MPQQGRASASCQPRRVCLIKPSSLGDVVHAFPLLAALRRHWPEARLSWVVNRGLRSLLDGHPDLDEVIPFDRNQIRFRPRAIGPVGRFLLDLRRREFDLAIDLQGLFRSGVMTVATGRPSGSASRRLAKGPGCSTTTRSTRAARDARRRPPAPGRRGVRGPGRAGARRRWRSRPPTSAGHGRAGPAAPPLGCLEHRRPVADQALAARALRRGRPPRPRPARRGVVLVGAPEDRPLVDSLRAARPVDARRPRPLRPDDPAATGRAGGRGRPVRLQRHRAAPPRRGGGGAHRRRLHLHEPGADRPVWPALGRGRRAASGAPRATARPARGWSAWPS